MAPKGIPGPYPNSEIEIILIKIKEIRTINKKKFEFLINWIDKLV